MFAIVLNDDLHQARTIIVRVGEKTSFLTDVTRNQEISLERDLTEGIATGKISLKAGDGTILAIGQGREQ